MHIVFSIPCHDYRVVRDESNKEIHHDRFGIFKAFIIPLGATFHP